MEGFCDWKRAFHLVTFYYDIVFYAGVSYVEYDVW